MRKWIIGAIVLGLLSGCAKKPEDQATDLLKAGNRDQAMQFLQGAEAKNPDNRAVHYLLFVLDQFMVSQGDPVQHDNFLKSSISEYDWISKDAGIDPDYRNMEDSIKAKDASRTAYENAYAAVFSR